MSETLKPKSFKPEDKESAAPTGSKGRSIKLSPRSKNKRKESAIPKDVANRMARRIAITTGLPTFCGMGVFIGSYILVSKGIADIPPALTLISSAICFLTGLIGLSYGILSASWETMPGSLLGIENIRPNIGKVRDAFNALLQNKD